MRRGCGSGRRGSGAIFRGALVGTGGGFGEGVTTGFGVGVGAGDGCAASVVNMPMVSGTGTYVRAPLHEV